MNELSFVSKLHGLSCTSSQLPRTFSILDENEKSFVCQLTELLCARRVEYLQNHLSSLDHGQQVDDERWYKIKPYIHFKRLPV